MDWSLNGGFDGGNIVSTGNPNEIKVMGGQMNFADGNQVWVYDLLNQAVLNCKQLTNECVLAKHSIFQADQTLMLGEDKMNMKFWEVYEHNTTGVSTQGTLDMPSNIGHLKHYNYNIPNLVVPHDESCKIDFTDRNYANKSIIFGNDLEPFQIEVDTVTGATDVIPICPDLYLQNFQGTSRIDHNRVFFAGGINSKLNNISNNAYVYNLNTREVIKTARMINIRYTFSMVICSGYIYAIGGREFGADAGAIMNQTERCDIINFEWEELGPLNQDRCTSNAFVIADTVYVAGGYTTTSTRTATIEKFDASTLEWMTIDFVLDEPIESCLTLHKGNQIYFMGGRSDEGDTNNKQLLEYTDGEIQANAQELESELEHKGCMKKVIRVNHLYFIFGGCSIDYIDIISHATMDKVTEEELFLNQM